MTEWLLWLALAAAALAGASWLALWSYGRFARQAQGVPSWAIPPAQDGALDALVPDGPDGAALIFEGPEALAIRLATTDLAERSIDVMTYIWSPDASGQRLTAALAQAARRGVRVRILLDDVNLWGRDRVWLALDRLPGVEVRVFNPVRARKGGIARGIEMMLLALRYNRRMHGKLWSVDGRLALTGGRNLGDGYFGQAQGRRRNQEDAEILLTGTRAAAQPGAGDAAPNGMVARIDAVFDEFWNSGLALPILTLWTGRLAGGRGGQRALARASRARPVPAGSAEDRAVLERVLARRRLDVGLRLIADPPGKALGLRPGPRGRRGWLPDHLAPVLASATRSLTIASPYLVPGRAGLDEMLALAARGVEVRILTNALAVIDHAIVHGAYRWYRPRLLAAGVRLFEFGSLGGGGAGGGSTLGSGSGLASGSGFGSSARRDTAMLHAKLAVIDGTMGFVGSFNFDLRSAWLNTELGVLFDDPELVAEAEAWLEGAMAPDRAWAVERSGRWTVWRRGEGRDLRLEPGSTAWRRVLTFVVGHLPIHRLL